MKHDTVNEPESWSINEAFKPRNVKEIVSTWEIARASWPPRKGEVDYCDWDSWIWISI